MKINGINAVNTNFMSSRKRIAETGIKIAVASVIAKEAKDVFERSMSYEKVNENILLDDEFEKFETDNFIEKRDVIDLYNIDLDMANSEVFRDKELFNPYLDDERDIEYSQYDEYDLPVPSMLNPFINSNILHNASFLLEKF